MNTKIIVLIGFSASGKDTLARELEKIGYHFIVSTTTRPMRNYEKEGDPYCFISKQEFISLMSDDQFIEVREYNTILNNNPEIWYYGVLEREVNDFKDNVIVLDLTGYRDFKKHYGDRCISFFIHADDEERKLRCIKRGDYDEGEFNRRLEDDRRKFPLTTIIKEVDHRIISDDINKNVEEILEIIKREGK